jgi:hypothetical protein
MSFALITLPLSQLAPSSGCGESAPEAGAPDIKLTLEMIRAGVAAYQAWDPDQEEIECLVVAVFGAMQRAKSPTHL